MSLANLASVMPPAKVYVQFPVVDPKHRPLGGHVLLQLETVQETTKSGLVYLPTHTKDDNEYLMQVAKLVAIGDLAFKNKETGEPWFGIWPQVGNIVRIPTHGGDRFKVDGTVFVMFKDAHIEAIVDID